MNTKIQGKEIIETVSDFWHRVNSKGIYVFEQKRDIY